MDEAGNLVAKIQASIADIVSIFATKVAMISGRMASHSLRNGVRLLPKN